MACGPPGPSVHRILHVGILEWVASPLSRICAFCESGSYKRWHKSGQPVSLEVTRYRSMWTLGIIPKKALQICVDQDWILRTVNMLLTHFLSQIKFYYEYGQCTLAHLLFKNRQVSVRMSIISLITIFILLVKNQHLVYLSITFKKLPYAVFWMFVSSPNSSVEVLTPNMTVLGGKTLGRLWGHEGGPLGWD